MSGLQNRQAVAYLLIPAHCTRKFFVFLGEFGLNRPGFGF
jgi:hypothetical protein